MDATGWCRKGKFQHDPSVVHAHCWLNWYLLPQERIADGRVVQGSSIPLQQRRKGCARELERGKSYAGRAGKSGGDREKNGAKNARARMIIGGVASTRLGEGLREDMAQGWARGASGAKSRQRDERQPPRRMATRYEKGYVCDSAERARRRNSRTYAGRTGSSDGRRRVKEAQ